ncbi:IQ calmodulin-binding motif-containing protein 1-like [Watersipora subatra]|uniref:IQ calmodulin-binding motif-containing protein 1-like n=1 Tax=Watersipora subatra TaxID=2589382 RepID=UPI00355BD35E
MPDETTEIDRALLRLVAEIAEATDRVVPTLLLQVRDLFNQIPAGTKEQAHFKKEVWNYELIQVLVLVLKQNFEYSDGKWKSAAELATFASNLFIGLDPPESHEYYGIILPTASENMLMLSRKLQVAYMEQRDASMKSDLLGHYRTTLEAVNTLFSGHVFITNHVLRSQWLLQMLISDDVDTCHAVLNLTQYAIRVNPKVVSSLDEKVLHALLDEMIFKIVSGDDKYVASAAISTLILICQVQPYFIQIICGRYRGLRPLMSRWSGQGFGKDLKEFVGLLDAGNARRVETEKFHRAATLIQSTFKSWRTRKALQKANTGIAKLQKSFRVKQKVQKKIADEQKQQSALQHQLLVSRKKAMRATREKNMQILNMLPAAAIPKHLENVQLQAAITVQAAWRGYVQRKVFGNLRTEVSRTKAATTIQRAARKFLARRAKLRNDPPAWQRAEGLTDECRVALQKVILDRREGNPYKERTRAEQEDLHNRCQDMLKRHVFTNRVDRRKKLHRDALLAELETDSDLLLNAPKLSELHEEDIDKFVSWSVPVATKAQGNHTNELRRLNQPWWRKLDDESHQMPYNDDILL